MPSCVTQCSDGTVLGWSMWSFGIIEDIALAEGGHWVVGLKVMVEWNVEKNMGETG